MSLKFYEAVKTILSDIESFLKVSLKSVNLPKSAISEKEDLLTKLRDLRIEFPQLEVETREKAADAVSQSERAAKVDSQEIYDAIGEDAKPEEESKPGSIKEASSASDISEVQPALSAGELSLSASISGSLVRKNPTKSKVDIKNLLLSVFGKKFCLVSSGIFFIFDKMTSKKHNSSFPLKGYEARVLADQPKREFCFELVCPGQKSYVFGASTQEEMDKWVIELNKEALTVPDSRLSVFCDDKSFVDDDDDLEYEDPSSMSVAIKTPSKPSQAPIIQKTPSVDDEIYDDVAESAPPPKSTPAIRTVPVPGRTVRVPVPSNDDDDQELYEEAESKVAPVSPENSEMDELYDDVQAAPTPTSTSVVNTQQNRSNPTVPCVQDPNIPYEKMFYGKWDCKADSDNELAFKRGDIIEVISQDYDKFGWWIGCLKGTVGLVPREYLTPAYELVSG